MTHNLFALQNAVKSIKPIVKNLSEMDKELDSITQVTTVGDLRSKLIEAEEAKVEVEAVLLERVICGKGKHLLRQSHSTLNLFQNALLQETAEEWEQCEKKLKDVRTWIEKTKTVIESPQQKKKPLRDQLGLCEKYLADSSIQKTKIQMSIEKLQVIVLAPHPPILTYQQKRYINPFRFTSGLALVVTQKFVKQPPTLCTIWMS